MEITFLVTAKLHKDQVPQLNEDAADLPNLQIPQATGFRHARRRAAHRNEARSMDHTVPCPPSARNCPLSPSLKIRCGGTLTTSCQSRSASSSDSWIDTNKSAGIQPQVICQELPRECYGVSLEVVTERKISQHLEEGMVASCPTDLLKVIMLTSSPYTLLRRYSTIKGWPIHTEEDALELDHARIREEKCRIILGNERRTG